MVDGVELGVGLGQGGQSLVGVADGLDVEGAADGHREAVQLVGLRPEVTEQRSSGAVGLPGGEDDPAVQFDGVLGNRERDHDSAPFPVVLAPLRAGPDDRCGSTRPAP